MAKKRTTKPRSKATVLKPKTPKYKLKALNVTINGRLFLKEQNFVFEPEGKDKSIANEIIAAFKKGYLEEVK